jgi:predicted protein tyrosine phosphatase
MSLMNRLGNITNRFQGSTRKVLCVCSAGLLRSPTAAVVLSQDPYNFNTRAAGISKEYALIPVDEVLVEWADEIVCMQKEHSEVLIKQYPLSRLKIKTLNIQDSYEYRDPELIRLIKEKYDLLPQRGGNKTS